jgi:hypothetical protein
MIFLIITGILVLIIIMVIYAHHWRKMSVGQYKWYVADYENKAEAAQILSRMNSKLIRFMRALKKKYHIDEPADVATKEGPQHDKVVGAPHDVYNIVSHLLHNYNPEVFYENDPRHSADTTYTIDKGSAMYICIRNKQRPYDFVDDNTLIFTILHECSHIANYTGWGHDIKFWTVFKFILHEAVAAGIYEPVYYDKHPVLFCGLNIDYQPLYDNNLANLWQ